jgi:hypothetical protein
MPSGTAFSITGALILAPLAVMTAFRPLRSVILFTLLAPFANVAVWLGWDPRLYWGLMLGARVLWERACGPQRKNLISGTVLLAWSLFCVVVACVLYGSRAELTSEDSAAALSLFLYFVAGSMFLFALLQFVAGDRQLNTVVRCCAAAALVVSLYAVWQAFTNYAMGKGDRVSATLDNPNYLATNLALASTGFLLVARRQRDRVSAIFFWGCAVAALVGTALTLSRAGIMSALVGWVLVYATRTGRLEYRRALLIFAVVALIAGAGAGAYLFNYRQAVTFSEDPNKADLADVTQAAEDLSRLEAALYAVQLIREHPVLGSGFATFPARNYYANGFYVTTHNTWLELLAGTGAVGTILLGTLVWSLACGLHKPGRILYLPVAGCFLVNSLFGDYLQSIDVIVILTVTYAFSWHQTGADFVPARKAVEG